MEEIVGKKGFLKKKLQDSMNALVLEGDENAKDILEKLDKNGTPDMSEYLSALEFTEADKEDVFSGLKQEQVEKLMELHGLMLGPVMEDLKGRGTEDVKGFFDRQLNRIVYLTGAFSVMPFNKVSAEKVDGIKKILENLSDGLRDRMPGKNEDEIFMLETLRDHTEEVLKEIKKV